MKLSDIKSRTLSISKKFRLKGREVKVGLSANPEERSVGFGVRITDENNKLRPADFLTFGGRVECKVFATHVSHCSLAPKLPQCKGCPLAEEAAG